MNRIIKFRGKRLDNGEWVYGDLLQIAGDCFIYFDSKTETSTPDIPKHSDVVVELMNNEIAVVSPESIGQFTGLYDCNSKEVYEGDIVCCDSWFNSEVFYHDELCAFVVDNPHKQMINLLWDFKEIRIVGNTYNPDLLKEE